MTATDLKTAHVIIKVLSNYHSIDISYYDKSFLYKSFLKRLNECCYIFKEDYIQLLTTDAHESSIFAESLKISYSEFFRNAYTFEVLKTKVLTELISNIIANNRTEIRIWSMACASGQEPYSIAILMKEVLHNFDKKINFRIFATDNNQAQIEKAKEAKFKVDYLKNVNLSRLKKWFIKNDEHYSINDEIKSHIDFSLFNLLDSDCYCPPNSIYGNFDLVICANVLFYLDGDCHKKVFEKISHCTSSSAYIVTGECEREIFRCNHYIEYYPTSGIFYNKIN